MRKFITLSLLCFLLILTACGQAEWGEERDLGKAAAENGDNERAVEHYEKAIELNPDFKEAKKELNLIKHKINKAEKAEKKKKEEQKKANKIAERQNSIKNWESNFKSGSLEEEYAPTIFEVFDDSYSKPSDIISQLQYDKDEKVITITAKGKDGWSDESIGLGFYEDSTMIYRELAKDQRLNEIWLSITFPMKDSHGNVTDDEVFSTWMSRETMDKINWNKFDYQKLIEVVDGKSIYPQFVQ